MVGCDESMATVSKRTVTRERERSEGSMRENFLNLVRKYRTTTSRDTGHSFQHRKFAPTCRPAEGVELGIGV